MLLDSTVFIDFARGYKPAIKAFEKVLHGQSASIVTKLELIAGKKTKRDAKKVGSILKNLLIDILPINEEVSKLGEEIFIKFYHSHGVGILDSFIAATALVYNEKLVTRNTKHFDFIPNLKLVRAY